MNRHAETIVKLLQRRITTAESEANLAESFELRHPESGTATLRTSIAKACLGEYRTALEWIETK
jgi:hypothetical protein